MWFHLRLSVHLLREYWLGISLRAIVAGVVVLACMICWWVGSSVIHDIDRQREALVLDVVLNSEIPSDSADRFVASVRRRPDIRSATMLDSQAVWLAFQKELGVSTTGLVELSALPRIVQLRVRSAYVTSHHIRLLRDAILHNNLFVVDRVLVPEITVRRLEMRRSDAMRVFIACISTLVIAAVCTFVWLFRALNISSLEAIARSNKRGWWWSHGSALLVSVFAMAIAKILAFAAIILLSAELHTRIDWLLPIRDTLTFPGWG